MEKTVDSEQKRILIMEDSDVFADMLMGLLDMPHYTLERAVNGFEGIKKVFSFMPHLIITDVEMPLFRGYQVTRLLKSRKNTQTIPIIMFTTLDKAENIFWGIQAGADMYIEKSPENLRPLCDAVAETLASSPDIDFAAIEREGKKINDNAIIEMVNNLLDSKLFQTTVIGMLTELSGGAHSLETVMSGILDLLHTTCETEIVTLMICGSRGTLYNCTANFAGFSGKISGDFSAISISDFNGLFPDYQVTVKNSQDLFPPGNNQKKITSYITIPLAIGGEKFASVHIANTISEYFTPAILENINAFLGAAAPVIANALSLRELAELQKNTRTAFARYVPADIMDEIIYESSKKASQSENRNVTVLFSDIRDFTAISEHSEAQNVVEFLNAYFAKMGNEITSEGGHIDKFIGDAIMAVFGAFRHYENSPSNAVRAALKMLGALDEMNEAGIGISNDRIRMGIGINCGECILGNIGFQDRMDYTLIGDTVNIASRIENLTKYYNHPFIVSEHVYEAVKGQFLLRKIDNVRVKGKGKPVGIYAVYAGFQDEADGSQQTSEERGYPSIPSLLINRETLENYLKGLQVFYMREWKLAQEYFSRALENDSSDFLSRLYLDRSVEFSREPPPHDWDGVITHIKN